MTASNLTQEELSVVVDAMNETLPLFPLPDLPNKVHGIVQLFPFVRVQCDGCGFVYNGPPGRVALGVILSDVLFNPRRYSAGDRRRLCRSCRCVEWPDFRGGAS